MTYVRVMRDQRGYETTFLLHTARPGVPARVLYWYRTAPGVRVGRSALDEEAIRSIEEQHPDIDFDWPQLLEEASTTPVDVERRPERRRKPQRPHDEVIAEAASVTAAAPPPPPPIEGAPRPAANARQEPPSPPPQTAPAIEHPRNALLDQLVGREIATRLRSRYRDLRSRIEASSADEQTRAGWGARLDALDPERWLTPQEILHGIEHADGLFDALRREVTGAH